MDWKSCKMYLSCEISCSSTSGYSQIQHISNLCLSVFHHFCSSMKKLLFQTIVESEKFPLKLLSKNRQTFRNRSECQFLCKKTPTWPGLDVKCLTWIKEPETKDRAKHLMRSKESSHSCSQKATVLFSEHYFQVTFCTVKYVFYSAAHTRTY